MSRATEPVNINGITFDALIDEIPRLSADIPAYPTEEGFEVSDTIIFKPKELSMTLFLTNTPVTWRSQNGSGPFRVNDVSNELEEMYFSHPQKLVTIRTSDKTYKNMGILNLEIPKKKETGSSREVFISFREVRTTEQSTTTIPASYGKSGATGANAGTAPATPSPTPGGAAAGDSAAGDGPASMAYNFASAAGLFGGR